MTEYLDSALKGRDSTAGAWFDRMLDRRLIALRGQFGFFDGSALRTHVPRLADMLAHGGLLRLVIGSNQSDPPTDDDLDVLSPLWETGDIAVALVGFANVLFHPKVFHVVFAEGGEAALVGSGNLTTAGQRQNIEAAVALDGSAEATRIAVADAGRGVDYWFADPVRTGAKVFTRRPRIDELLAAGLIVRATDRRRRRAEARADQTTAKRPHWSHGWTRVGRAVDVEDDSLGLEPAEQVVLPTVVVARWCKRLTPSDAQQTSSRQRKVHRAQTKRTNATGKLRLTKSTFKALDAEDFFRSVLFGREGWTTADRQGNPVQQTTITFAVDRPGESRAEMTLMADYAAHRGEKGGEPTTVLQWGRELGGWLKANSQVGNWVTIESFSDGSYRLAFPDKDPGWSEAVVEA